MSTKRILIVDDEVQFARLLKLNLETTGKYEVRVENWPEDAMNAAREFKPNVVLLDLMMPRMPGGNVAAGFESDPELKGIPIIFLTGVLSVERIAENEGNICDHPCIAKLTRTDEIIAAIEKYARPNPL